ncbi:PIKK family atypical protein kinase [Trichomonas vaginalis G3]|uniref:non-specific serine/threonine protein kinase n=1 Tax=Trichomonas vaginalis (strain ATCC PRA-98 / G3) TaxID=412133 RepID=A2EN34_TRIV3|nr:ataxia telangiectasia mutated (ATM) -related family [Trichomonas vaginalis G3]EAY05942.1 PIKK family atypical protein kinase [Trichomonas vaginalis G3]KAI5530180.1 ataxia telangiectasia mutated (ATM) -related family [Trichomonas vaginalis G3]|eukprot:XP_001318165.1 PIKK family atypical protein kinase [Trichomonas vaginalis G3]
MQQPAFFGVTYGLPSQDATKLERYIKNIFDNIDNIHSYSYYSAIKTFQSFVSGQYRYWQEMNEGSAYIQELFLNLSFSKLQENTLVFLIVMNALSEIELGTKGGLATKIVKDIALITPSPNVHVWQLLDQLLVWITNPLGASLHLTLQPLRDLIWKWYFVKKPETQISSLNLLDIFIRRFPSYLNSNFQATQSLLLRALHEPDKAVQKAASQALGSFLSISQTQYVNQSILISKQIMKSFTNKTIPLEEGYVVSIANCLRRDDDILGFVQFQEPPISRISYTLTNDTIGGFALITLAYHTSPLTFTQRHINAVLDIYCTLFESTTPLPRTLYKYFGDLLFQFDMPTRYQYSKPIERLTGILGRQISDKYSVYGFLSVATPKTEAFIKLKTTISNHLFSKLVANGLGKFCLRYPKDSPDIHALIIQSLNMILLTCTNTTKLKHSFRTLACFEFRRDEVETEVLMQYSKALKSNDVRLREQTINFFLSQQRIFPEIKQRIVAFVAAEPSPALRNYTLSNLLATPVDSPLIQPLFALLHDANAAVRKTALQKLSSINNTEEAITSFISELVRNLQNSEKLDKRTINNLLNAAEFTPQSLIPFRSFLMDVVIKSSKQSSSSLRLLSKLVDKTETDSVLPRIVEHISQSLTLHSTNNRLSAVLDLLIATLRNSSLRNDMRIKYSNVIMKLMALADGVEDKETRIKLLEALTEIAIIGKHEMLTWSIETTQNLPSQPVPYPTSAVASMPVLSALSANTSFGIVLNVLTDSSLVALHPKAIDSLLLVLKSHRILNPQFEDYLANVLRSMILEADNSATVSIILHNLSVFITILGNKFAPIIPPLIDLICTNWGRLESGLILRALQWMAFRISELLSPYLVRITNVILSSLPLLPAKAADDVFSIYISMGSMMKEVDYILVPSLLNWLEVNFADTFLSEQVIQKLLTILNEVGTERYVSEVIRTLIIVCTQNKSLQTKSIDVLILLAARQRNEFILFLPEIVPVFNLSNNSNMDIIMRSITSGVELPQFITESYKSTTREAKISRCSSAAALERFVYIKPSNFRLPKTEWDAAEWSHWADEVVQAIILSSPLRSSSACGTLSEHNANVRSQLFPISFAASIATSNDPDLQQALHNIIMSKDVPDYILKNALNSVDLLDIANFKVDLDMTILANRAMKAGLLQQALRYAETLYEKNPTDNVENLVLLYQMLGFPFAANAALRKFNAPELHDNVAIHLGFWEDALASYERRIEQGETGQDIIEGQMKCLTGLNRFQDLEVIAQKTDNEFYKAVAALHMFNDEALKKAVSKLDPPNDSTSFYYAFKAVLDQDYLGAQKLIEMMLTQKAPKITSLIANDYERAYNHFADYCILTELFNVTKILINRAHNFIDPSYENSITKSWMFKFEQLHDSPLHMLEMLRVESFILGPEQMQPFWVKFIHYTANDKNAQIRNLALGHIINQNDTELKYTMAEVIRYEGNHPKSCQTLHQLINLSPNSPLTDKWQRKLGQWYLEDNDLIQAEEILKRSTIPFKDDSNTLLLYAKVCFQLFEGQRDNESYLERAIEANLTAFRLAPVQASQYIQHIATLLFQRGHPKVLNSFRKFIPRIPTSCWIDLLSQIIARLGASGGLRQIMEDLVTRIGKEYPNQALYALIVQYRSKETEKQQQSSELISNLRQSYPTVVSGILNLTYELIRIGTSWFEIWTQALEETSKMYDHVKAANILLPLHAVIEKPPETMFEVSFAAQFGSVLLQAHSLLDAFLNDHDEDAYNRAWSIYVPVLKKVRLIVQRVKNIPLNEVSPLLSQLKGSDTVVPGHFDQTIHSVDKQLIVVESKQRPRRVTLRTNEGNSIDFLLKANEDTRLDKRIMQLFDFINSAIERAPDRPRRLRIILYKVIPITNKVGLIGWVNNCQTLSLVISQYREPRGVPSLAEYEAIVKECPDFDKLSATMDDDELVRLFHIGVSITPGNELKDALFIMSSDSSHWLKRRALFTESLASTSMAGFILGLGDRHPANIMLHDTTAKLVHIDFGDCFEVAMRREKFQERVPFRLTRSLVNALGVNGLDGEFTKACETMLTIMRENGVQIMALLEAFIYDPLLQWLMARSDAGERPEIETMKRIKEKINDARGVKQQVASLVEAATDERNLARMFRGWYPWL